MKISDLYKPQTFPKGANIDPRYWTDNGDGTYSATPILIYSIARDATEYFKKQIVKLDKEVEAQVQYGGRKIKLGNYHFRDVDVKTVDKYENQMISREYEIKYANELKEVNAKWRAYQKSHPDEFSITYGVQKPAIGDHDENSYFNAFNFDGKALSLQEAVAACSAAMNLLAKYKSGGSEYSTLPMTTSDIYRSKKEFSEKHQEIKQSFIDEAGIPAKVEVPEDQLPVTIGDSEPKFSSKNYQKSVKNAPGITIENFDEKIMNAAQDEEAFGEFASDLIVYVTSTTKEQHMNALADKIRSVGQEFEQKFNETSKIFKAVEVANGYEIFVNGDADKSPEKIITLSNQKDHWDCVLRANIDGLDIGFKGTVDNYGEFKKILGIFAKTLDVAGRSDMAEDLTEVANSL